jgi:protein-S-isoprenylcysteine O-methyltransferase Ste14
MAFTTPKSNTAAPARPDFIPSAITGWVGFIGFVIGVVWLNKSGPLYEFSRYWEALIIMGFTSVPMLVCDALLLFYGGQEGPIDGMTRQRDYSLERTGIKFAGLLGSVGLLAFLYWVFPEYNPSFKPDAGFYSNFFLICRWAGPWVLGVCAVYFYFVDARMNDPRDGYWYFGRLLILKFDGTDWPKVRNHLRTWAVKGFFMPLMFTFLCSNLPGLHWHGFTNYGALHGYLNNFLFSIDLAFVCCGYVLTLRVVQSHVRSAEPTALGWTAALICYQPFWTMFGNLYLGYWSDGDWGSKLPANSVLIYTCGVSILIFEALFVWATISFGLRFSNLTHRGIVTKGPYYFTKHPAYITKLCAFFLISLPWLDTRGAAQGARNMFMLAGLGFVYWLRAKTEERHLTSIDPAYGIYAEQIRQRHRRWLRLQFGQKS